MSIKPFTISNKIQFQHVFINGTGCMLSAILGAFIAVGQSSLLETTAYTVALMGYCGELTSQKIRNRDEGKT